MSTESSSPPTRLSPSKLAWACAGVLALVLSSFVLSVPQAEGTVEDAGTRPTRTPAATVIGIDHSAVEWDKITTAQEDAGASIAAYER
jgi:hypothetical protein